jgi:hypothetical protein
MTYEKPLWGLLDSCHFIGWLVRRAGMTSSSRQECLRAKNNNNNWTTCTRPTAEAAVDFDECSDDEL